MSLLKLSYVYVRGKWDIILLVRLYYKTMVMGHYYYDYYIRFYLRRKNCGIVSIFEEVSVFKKVVYQGAVTVFSSWWETLPAEIHQEQCPQSNKNKEINSANNLRSWSGVFLQARL